MLFDSMDTWFTFFLKKGSLAPLALKELASCGLAQESVIKDFETGIISICAIADETKFLSSWRHIDSYIKLSTSEINWTDQWTSFSPYFKEGLCQIPLSDFSSSQEIVSLHPGPGFGDLSHPTTFLSLEMMGPFVQNKTVLDLGCGSGVLGLVALKLGAVKSYSLDIDSEALSHTEKNAKLNGLEDRLIASSDLVINPNPVPSVLLLNMIFSEQKQAIASLSQETLKRLSLWIVSGILEEQKEDYIAWAALQGLTLQSVKAKEGWLGFVFERNQFQQHLSH